MRTLRKFQMIGVVAGVYLAGGAAVADLEVTTSVQIRVRADFEAPLGSQGTWVEFGSHGRCWRPAHIAVGWRPYCAGEWVWTDCGWYWSSDEPWAWACYHYGYWLEDPVLGWVWVPGVEWAPAWVSWRVGGGYIGWAPLPPPGLVWAVHPGMEAFVFVGEAKFGGPIRPGAVLIKDAGLYKRTMPLGGMQRETRSFGGSSSQRVMVNNGPSLERVQKATGKAFATVSIRDAARRTPGPAKNAKAYAASNSVTGKKGDENQVEHGRGGETGPHAGPGLDTGTGRDFGAFDRGDHGGRSFGGGAREKHQNQ